MPLWLFAFVAALSIVSALGVIVQRNVVHCLLSLVVTLLAIAVLFIGMGAVAVGFLQAIVYAGAIMVLFLYVVMLVNRPQEDASEWDRAHPLRQPGVARFGAGLAIILVLQLAWALLRTGGVREAVAGQGGEEAVSSVAAIGRAIFSDYQFAFEATSVLILVALVGGVYLAHRESDR